MKRICMIFLDFFNCINSCVRYVHEKIHVHRIHSLTYRGESGAGRAANPLA
jgi:hypothetical protein